MWYGGYVVWWGYQGYQMSVEFMRVFEPTFPISGEDYSKWIYYSWIFGGVDSFGQVSRHGLGGWGRTLSRKGRATCSCGLLCWQSLHTVSTWHAHSVHMRHASSDFPSGCSLSTTRMKRRRGRFCQPQQQLVSLWPLELQWAESFSVWKR